MSLLLVYRAFRADLQGWVKIDFPTFREVYDPLRRRRTWTEDDKKRLLTVAALGGAHALRRLYSRSAATKEQIETLLGPWGRDPEYMSREELDSQMKYLIENCLRDGWNPQTFINFGAYLNSDKGPDDLAKITVSGSTSTLFQSAPPASVAISESEKKTSPPTTDMFAEKYRAAGVAFKNAVQEHLREGARRATERVQAELKSVISTTAIDPITSDLVESTTSSEAKAAKEDSAADLIASLRSLGQK